VKESKRKLDPVKNKDLGYRGMIRQQSKEKKKHGAFSMRVWTCSIKLGGTLQVAEARV